MRTTLAFSTTVGLLLFVVAVLGRSGLVEAANISDFPEFSLLDSNNNVLLPGRLHTPPAFTTNPNQPLPLILYLHGAGQSGTDNVNHIVQTDLNNMVAAARRFGFFIYAPQTNSGWGSTDVLSGAMTMIDRAIAERRVDGQRVYVTGLSMGGGGVWNFLNEHADRFAAAVPICAVGPSEEFQPANLLNESIWAFHARNDNVVPVTSSRSVIDSLLTEGQHSLPSYPSLSDFSSDFIFDNSSLDLHYTELRSGSHVIWEQVYQNRLVYDWMLARRSVPEPASSLLIAIGSTITCFRRRFA